MAELQTSENIAQPGTEDTAFSGTVVQLEATEETAQILLDASSRTARTLKIVLTYKGRALAEVVRLEDAAFLSRLKGRATGLAGIPAGAVKPAAPDPDWEQRWKALQARVVSELGGDLTEDEIDEGIEQAIQAARRDRLARHP